MKFSRLYYTRLDKLLWVLVALALGWVAQELFSRDLLWPGLLLYLVAIPIFAIQLATPQRKESQRPVPSPLLFNLRISSDIRGEIGMAIMSGALILSGHSWFLFGPETRNTVAWAAYAASLLLFGLGVWLAEDTSTQLREGQAWNGSVPESPPSSRLDLWLIAILLLALFLRLFQFSSLPLWHLVRRGRKWPSGATRFGKSQLPPHLRPVHSRARPLHLSDRGRVQGVRYLDSVNPPCQCCHGSGHGVGRLSARP